MGDEDRRDAMAVSAQDRVAIGGVHTLRSPLNNPFARCGEMRKWTDVVIVVFSLICSLRGFEGVFAGACDKFCMLSTSRRSGYVDCRAAKR